MQLGKGSWWQRASIPRTGSIRPSSPSSPMNMSLGVSGIWPVAWSIAMAIGRSSRGPCFLISAGERLIVYWRGGNSNPECFSADLIRVLLSFTTVSARPTIISEGMPFVVSTSIVIGVGLIPVRVNPVSLERFVVM